MSLWQTELDQTFSPNSFINQSRQTYLAADMDLFVLSLPKAIIRKKRMGDLTNRKGEKTRKKN
jgi:hypothetical protein